MKEIENAGLNTMTTIDQILVRKVNELVKEVNELKTQLSRVHKDKPDPKQVSPYDLSSRRRYW